MTSCEINSLHSTYDHSHGGSREAILLHDTVIKFPRDVKSIDITNLTLEEIFNRSEHPTDKYCLTTHFGGHISNWLGIEQMLAEWDIWDHCPEHLRYLLCPILDRGFTDTGVPYTIMQRANTFTDWEEGDEDFDECVRANFDLSEEDLDSLCDDIDELCRVCQFSSGDIYTNTSNLGELNGRLVVIDYGWGHEWI